MARLVDVLRDATELFVEVDSDWRITHLCRQCEAYLGRKRQELAGQRLWDVFPDELDSHFYGECLRAVAERNSVVFDEYYPLVEKWASAAIYPAEEGVSIYLRDVTSYKHKDIALGESEEKLRQLLLSASEAIIVANASGRIVLVNDRAQEKFGYSRDELFGRPVETLLPHGVRHAHVSHRERYFASPHNRPMGIGLDLWACRKDGTEFPVEVSLSFVKTENDSLVMSFVTDITERKKYEERLREQAELLNQTQDAILVRDTADTILFWNKAAEAIYGWTPEEALGKKSVDLYYDGPSPVFESAKKAVLRDGNWSGEFTHVTKQGTSLLVESRWTLVPGSGHSAPRILIINTDVSSKRKLENQLLRAQRMESIGTLASGIAHDLNNILAPIMMAIGVLGARVHDVEGRKILSMLQKNAERGADLVRQVLQFARGVQGERALIQPSHIIREIVKILGQTFPKSIEVRYQLPESVAVVSGDPTQLHQVLMNLCLNARDAMPHGGTLTIAAENLYMDEAYARMNIGAKPGDYLCLSISDTGTGISKDVMERMFEPFYTTKEQGKGTGLGLSTVMGIVKGHGGFVNVYSESGKGSLFKVYIPAARENVTAEIRPADADMPYGCGETVLIVDDEAAIREITKGTLEAFGYKALTAGDGTEAVALYAQHQTQIAVVLTDMMMPYLDGAATIRALRRINPSVKVIASSGLAANGKTVAADPAGATEFLTKPYTAQSLLQVLHRVLRGESRAEIN